MLPRFWLETSWRALARATACVAALAASMRAAETKKGPGEIGDTSTMAMKGAIEMPPFVITESKGDKPWRYAEGEGFEILSQCDDDTTQQVFAALWRGPRLTLPPALRPNNATPMAVIIFNQPPDKLSGMQAMGSVQASHEEGSHWTNVIKRTLHDREVFSVNLYGRDFRGSSTFRFDLRTLLALHTPAAPPWLIEALHGNYGIYREGIRYVEGDKDTEIVRALWDSTAERQQAAALLELAQKRFATPPAKRTKDLAGSSPVGNLVPPLAVLWNGGVAADNATPQQRARWAATCGLFAHWALYAEKGKRRDAFWRFATEVCSRPVTEEFFRECFGLGYDEARIELGWHLPIAVGEPAHGQVAPLKAPKIKPRPATVPEIGRLRGEFARGEALLLGERFPEIAAQYRRQAASVLGAGYAADRTDARLAAILGLSTYEQGDLPKARELLQAATATGQARPRAWFALAHLRFTEAVAAPGGPKGQLNSEQASSVFIPLSEALRSSPAMVSSYELLAELWRRTREVPAGEILARLEEGQRAFPRHTRLALTCVRVCIERGEHTAALAFIDRALPLTVDAAMKQRLEKTRAALAESLATTPAGAK
jgi:hypothetical protein